MGLKNRIKCILGVSEGKIKSKFVLSQNDEEFSVINQ